MTTRRGFLTAVVALVGLCAEGLRSPAEAATCTGANPCNACKNCSSCKRCAQQGGTCGVCRRKIAESHGESNVQATTSPNDTKPRAVESHGTRA